LRPPPTAHAAADGELIQHSRLEPERFAVIYDRHAPAVHRYAQGLPVGWVLSFTAMLRIEIVDQPGQLP
jgi:hypothetical protein